MSELDIYGYGRDFYGYRKKFGVLFQFAIQGKGGEACLLQLAHQLFATQFGIAKGQCRGWPHALQGAGNHIQTLVRVDLVEPLLDLAIVVQRFHFYLQEKT